MVRRSLLLSSAQQIMNFDIQITLASGGRLGNVTHTLSEKPVSFETPSCTLFTKGGSAPYLSISMLERVKYQPEIATMSINAFVENIDSVKGSGKKLADFTSLKNKLVFSSLNDASVAMVSGKNDKTGVAVWGKGGKSMLDVASYAKMLEATQCDWVMALSDGDTDKESTEKRAGKAVDRTLDFLDSLVTALNKNEVLQKSCLIGAVTGGFSERHRVRSATETASRPVQGFLLEGFQKGNTDKNVFDNDAFAKILTKTLSCLPENKVRIMETSWSPVQVLQAVKLGIDVFSSAYPHTLTEKGFAMCEDFSLPPKSSVECLEKGGDGDNKVCSDATHNVSTLDLNHKRFFEDFSPVLEGCDCYTCRTFTRSYIHHLLNTSELLAYVLLTIHNFERYFLFFQTLRGAMKDGRFEELENSLKQQSERNSN